MDYFTPAIGLAGVVIGGWLSPWLTSRIEDAKIKKAIKPQLIQNVYEFFQVRKLYMQMLNRHNYEMRKSQFFFEALVSRQNTPEEKEKFERVYEALNRDNQSARIYGHLDTLTKTEAVITSLVAQISHFYNTSTYNAIFKLLKPHLDQSNDDCSLYKYESMTTLEIDALHPTFSDQILNAGKKLDPICDEVISKIMKTL